MCANRVANTHVVCVICVAYLRVHLIKKFRLPQCMLHVARVCLCVCVCASRCMPGIAVHAPRATGQRNLLVATSFYYGVGAHFWIFRRAQVRRSSMPLTAGTNP